MTDHVHIEFTVEPFVPAQPGPHVLASIEAARSLASEPVEVGPFGTATSGSREEILQMTQAILQAALSNGASRVSLQVSAEPTEEKQ